MTQPMIIEQEIRHAHLFCGIGGGAKGFNRGQARVGNVRAKFRCIGGIDVDAPACRDFDRHIGARASCLDLFSLEQYQMFHGRMPPPGWEERGPADITEAFDGRPHIAFLSAPCKGFSGLLSEKVSLNAKYQALNGLTLRGIDLMLRAYADDPIELIVFENVPRIATRGRHLLDDIVARLRRAGYAVAETFHDCGELGNLAQSRKRFLLVARHTEKIPAFLHEPVKHRLRGVGEVLDELPLPLSGLGGPMHRMPALQWQTWVRLAFAVADVRVDGHEKSVQLGVRAWTKHSVVVRGNMAPGAGPNSVADPRLHNGRRFNNVFRIVRWGDTAIAVAGPGGTGPAVADPRYGNWSDDASTSKLHVTEWEGNARPITGSQQVASGAGVVADPRYGDNPNRMKNSFKLTGWENNAGVVTSGHSPSNGGGAVADPRPAFVRDGRKAFEHGGHYGVVRFDTPTPRSVTGSGQHDNGFNSVADPRVVDDKADENYSQDYSLPALRERLVCIIVARDNTWHRPFTTLELAALQGLVDPAEQFELDGLSDASWRERIGNCVPPPSAQAIAGVMGETLLLAWSGQTFQLSSTPIWVRSVAAGLSVRPQEIGDDV